MHTYLRAMIAALALTICAIGAASAQSDEVERGPFGVQLVLLHECRIDFSQIKWIGDHSDPNLQTEKAAMQAAWMVSKLPVKCFERKCVFGNITQDTAHIYDRLQIVRFMERLEPEMAEAIAEAMKGCMIERPPYLSLNNSESGSGVVCVSGNSFTLMITGDNNTVHATQEGCNTASIVINGNNITLVIHQVGSNSLALSLNGDNIHASVSQYGSNVYSGTLSSNAVAAITQNNS